MNEDLILQYYRNPEHYRVIDGIIPIASLNPTCGDELLFYIRRNDAGEIVDMTYQGAACSVCLASAEIVCEFAEKNKRLMTSEELLKLLEMTPDHKRLRCATLAIISNS